MTQAPIRTLPMLGITHGNRNPVTCHLRCGDACAKPIPNQSGAPSFVSALEGARNLAVMEAVRTAVESGRTTPVARISG